MPTAASVSNLPLLSRLVEEYGDAPVALAVPHLQMADLFLDLSAALFITQSVRSRLTADERAILVKAQGALDRLHGLHQQMGKAIKPRPIHLGVPVPGEML